MARVYQAPTKGATKTEENHFGERLDNTLSICYNHDYHDYHEHESDAGRGWLPNSKIERIPMMRRRNEEVVVYHVGLALEPEQVKQLKQLALEHDKTVRDFVTDLVLAVVAAEDTNESWVKRLLGKKKKKKEEQ